MNKAIITECFVDSNLIETLVPDKGGYNKQHGCKKVVGVMMKQLKNEFALGIIDKDKERVQYLDEFVEIDKVNPHLILWKHKDPKVHHYLIHIVPAIEKWVYNITSELSVDVSRHGLPSRFEDLRTFTKTRTAKDDPAFKALFKELRTKDHDAVKKLIHWVITLKTKNYRVTIEELKEIN